MAFVVPTSDQNAQPTIDIAPQGDLVFLVGPDRKRLRVHSIFVKTASPVFSAMLSPSFKEGQQLAESGLLEIRLPEDDAGAIEIVFNVIHGRNEKVPKTLTPEELVQVAVTIDKYDCHNSLWFAIQVWATHICIRSLTEPASVWSLAVLAMLRRNRDMFAEMTSNLICNHSGSYIDLVLKYQAIIDPTILLKIAVRLEESRNKLRMNFIHDALGGDWQCTATSKKGRHKPDWLKEFVYRIGDLSKRSISSVLEALDSVEVLDVPIVCDFDPGPNNLRSIFNSITEKCRRRHDDEGGLCLLCVTNEDDHENHISSGM